jgi:hypothetical protein
VVNALIFLIRLNSYDETITKMAIERAQKIHDFCWIKVPVVSNGSREAGNVKNADGRAGKNIISDEKLNARSPTRH